LRIEKTALSTDILEEGVLGDVRVIESTDIYTWLFGWFSASRATDSSGKGADLKINIILPATDLHIRKYTTQRIIMVRETPDIYTRVVAPYIDSLPKSRTQWVDNILSGISEQSKILYSCPEFVILPDMKWDLITVSSLYLVAIAREKNQGELGPRRVRSMRDLRKSDLTWLKKIRSDAGKIVKERWDLAEGSVRFFIHYQPSYYHFHVHIVNANYMGLGAGMTVGQAWLLDDIISLLDLDPPTRPSANPDPQSDSIMERMTFTYGLGEQHGLFEGMRRAQAALDDQKE